MRLIIRSLFYIFLLTCPVFLLGQDANTLTGIVVDVETGEPMTGVSVFVNNSTYGVSTNQQGRFSLARLPKGRHEIVVSLLGYQTMTFVVEVGERPLAPRRIMMDIKSQVLKEVDISPYSRSLWEQWGQIFLNAFIGTSSFSRQCKLLNHKDLRFSYDKQNRVLSVSALEPLIIENKALGYRLSYLLEEFFIDYKSGIQFYMGYPKFEELKGSQRVMRRYAQNRQKAYSGSMLHFLRAVYQGNVAENGFEVYPMQRIPNLEKQRVKQMRIDPAILYGATIRLQGDAGSAGDTNNEEQQKSYPKDSLEYYRYVLRLADTLDYIDFNHPVGPDSLVQEEIEGYKKIYFKDYLYIIAKSGEEDPVYYKEIVKPSRRPAPPSSTLKIRDKDAPIYIDPMGNYFEPKNLFSTLYWGWYSTIATLLPIDYGL